MVFGVNIQISNKVESQTTESLEGPMDSAWPMYCHDTRHTGRSSYSTVDNTGFEKWKLRLHGLVWGSPVIDDDGIIYIGAWNFYAVYPNGTIKWQNDISAISSAAAIDENGIIYVGTIWAHPNYMYAIYKNNGTIKWKYPVGNLIQTSPAIGDDGSIYFGSEDDYIYALYPNGTLKWKYLTSVAVYSSPAIGDDGTIYCGSHDGALYALYPNNGTLKWAYGTGDWVARGPSIADDGTIYFSSWDGYLYAVYPNGTLKWKTGGYLCGTTPITGNDGTIYVGNKQLSAIYPENGTVKWAFPLGQNEDIRSSNPCISADGTIYFGTFEGGKIYAVNSDGTKKWWASIGGDVRSAPVIGEDGTVYIGDGIDDGYLHAFGIGELGADANGPYYDLINQPVQFTGTSSGGHSPHSYHWDFGDTYTSEEQNPTHTYTNSGNYDVVLTVTDNEQNTAIDTTFAWIQTSNTAPNKPAINGPTSGNAGTSYDYTFSAIDPDGSSIYYYVDWGDSSNSGWLGPYDSDETITESHTWSGQGTFTISAKAKDPYNEEGPWGEFNVNMKTRNRATTNSLILQFLERFPLLKEVLSRLITN